MKTLKLEVITPSKKAFDDSVSAVTLPGTAGSFQVLYNHAPLMSSLEIGVVKIIDTNEKENFFAIGGGTVEVLDNKVLVLAESFERPDEIDIERAEKAKQRAKERLSSKDKDIDNARAEAALKRAVNRLKLTKKID